MLASPLSQILAAPLPLLCRRSPWHWRNQVVPSESLDAIVVLWRTEPVLAQQPFLVRSPDFEDRGWNQLPGQHAGNLSRYLSHQMQLVVSINGELYIQLAQLVQKWVCTRGRFTHFRLD